jgi:hypothetical protein
VNVPVPRGKNPAAFPETNHVFAIVQVPPANAVPSPSPLTPAAGNPNNDDSVCIQFGYKGTGCIAVFRHKGEDRLEDDR